MIRADLAVNLNSNVMNVADEEQLEVLEEMIDNHLEAKDKHVMVIGTVQNVK